MSTPSASAAGTVRNNFGISSDSIFIDGKYSADESLKQDSKSLKVPEGVKIIRERNASELNADILAHVSNDNYIIAAVLPVISVDESGTYDFNLNLSDDIDAGAKLFWFAFAEPEASEDEETAEFFDDTGAEISTVPDNHIITVSAWLNKGKIYAPIIAISRLH